MQVETYEIETAHEPIEAQEEALRLMEELGLEGQQSLIGKAASGDVRIPYREMTKQEADIYGILCPSRYDLESYSVSAIPLRVLQVLAHAKSLEVFDKIIILDKESAEIKDPVAVGIIGTEWSGKRYILARWGEHLDEMPALIKQAAAIHRDAVVSKLQEIIEEAKGILEHVKVQPDSQLISRKSPTFYGS